jgi:3-hydroxyisobutyrate dehydrogenase
MARCAYLGLGVMGAPMARHLVRAGHDVAVWNRTAAKAVSWCAENAGRMTMSPDEAADGAEFIFMCLGDDPDVEEVFERIAPGLQAGQTLVDHTTGSPGLARRLFDAAATRGADFLDAPVSGGQAGAEAGKLTIMVGGRKEAHSRAEEVMAAYARQITLIGEAGAGQLAKAVNQICIAGVVQGLAEGLHFARLAGLDEARVIEAVSKGAAQSWQMENRWRSMVDNRFDFGFAVDWMRKDLRIALETARQTGARLPLTALVDQFYADVQAAGGGRWDTSSLISRLRGEPETCP